MIPDRLLNEDALYDAMRLLFSVEYWHLCEEEGIGEGAKTTTQGKAIVSDWAPSRFTLLPFGWHLVGRVEQAWGSPVGLVFHHAGVLSAEDQEHALGDLFLGIQGHGVCLADEFSNHIAKAEEVLGKLTPVTFDPVPFEDEMEWLRELAEEVLAANR